MYNFKFMDLSKPKVQDKCYNSTFLLYLLTDFFGSCFKPLSLCEIITQRLTYTLTYYILTLHYIALLTLPYLHITLHYLHHLLL